MHGCIPGNPHTYMSLLSPLVVTTFFSCPAMVTGREKIGQVVLRLAAMNVPKAAWLG